MEVNRIYWFTRYCLGVIVAYTFPGEINVGVILESFP